MRYKTFDGFSKQAKDMRREFDARFANPHEARADRFVWDYWHVPDQYTLLRTPAHTFFKPKLYTEFHRHLVEWGRENLGCHDVSPPWMSCYVEGCRQEIHSDVPHGPLAFVFSLTNWSSRDFKGGETFLLNTEAQGFEKSDLIEKIEPKFNRLTIFDPSIPHGVEEVRGVNDVLKGRLVIHGWFANPRPFWYGPLNVTDIENTLNDGLASALSGQLALGAGLLSSRLEIAAEGRVRSVKTLINTLKHTDQVEVRKLNKILSGLKFPKRRAETRLILPLICE